DVQRFYNPFYYMIGGMDRASGEYFLHGLNPETGTEYLNYFEGRKDVTSSTYMESAINYDRELGGGDHTIGGLLVFYMRNQLVGNAGSLQNSLAFRNMGLSGRATYGYKSRYFLEANFGYNGSERFSKSNRYGFFPSVGAGWIVSNESFWGDPIKRVIPKLKFRITDGLVGNDAIGSATDRFFHLSQVNMNDATKGFTFGSELSNTRNGVTVSRYENQDISWETARKTNLGVEVSLLNAFDINVDLYTENRTNILMNR